MRRRGRPHSPDRLDREDHDVEGDRGRLRRRRHLPGLHRAHRGPVLLSTSTRSAATSARTARARCSGSPSGSARPGRVSRSRTPSSTSALRRDRQLLGLRGGVAGRSRRSRRCSWPDRRRDLSPWGAGHERGRRRRVQDDLPGLVPGAHDAHPRARFTSTGRRSSRRSSSRTARSTRRSTRAKPYSSDSGQRHFNDGDGIYVRSGEMTLEPRRATRFPRRSSRSTCSAARRARIHMLHADGPGARRRPDRRRRPLRRSAPPGTSRPSFPIRPTRSSSRATPSAARGTSSATRVSARTPTCTPSATGSARGPREAIADGPSILQYVRDTAREAGIDRHIRFGHRVVRAEWSTPDARWTVEAERTDAGETLQLTCGFIVRLRAATTTTTRLPPRVPGPGPLHGTVVHPQHWPADLDYTGKSVVVIGSGATAVTLVPAMAHARRARDDAATLADLHRLPPARRTRSRTG